MTLKEKSPVVVKIGGNEIQEAHYVQDLARAIAGFAQPVVVVHGGGRAIGEMQEKLGLVPKKVDGLRVTDAASLAVAQMVLSGDVNKRIVQAILAQGAKAVGLSGVDAGLLRCRRKQYHEQDLGLVGEIVEVNIELLTLLLSQGMIPVVSPISLGLDGATYNVNADEAAGAIAAAIQAQRVWFISNVAAVLDADGRALDVLTPSQAASLIEAKVIRDGMVPKVQTALAAMEAGVREAVIANTEGFVAGRGTRFVLFQRSPEESATSL